MHTLTAKEFIAQGTTAGAIMSIAEYNQEARAALRAVAREVSRLTGQSLQVPGAVTLARMDSRRAHNDNRGYRRRAA